jgi:hypothetical protein
MADTETQQVLKLVQSRKSGNYMIFTKSPDGSTKNITLKLTDVCFPFGRELFNNKSICNIEFDKETNKKAYENLVVLSAAFENLKASTGTSYKYNITDKTFCPFMRKVSQNSDTNTYIVRTYLKYETPIVNTRFVGLHSENDLCNKTAKEVNLEVGSLWVNETQYGIIIYINDITLN